MNNEDKILLMAYVDGELDSAEVLRAEALMSSNQAANEFVNQLKTANATIQASYQTSEYNELDKRLDSFVNKNFKKNKASIAELISSFFISRQILNYSLTALLFLSVGMFYDDLIPPNNDINLFDLNKTTYEKKVFKTRGFEETENIKDLLSTTIDEMIKDRSSEGKLIYGSDSYVIFLEEKIGHTEKFFCYSGVILNDGFSKDLFYCISKNDKALIYIN